jgi:hypothetical protein
MKTTILPFHPTPIQTRVIHVPAGAATATTIARQWPAGTSASCRLCDRCVALNDFCVLVIHGYVRRDDAPEFSTRGMPRADTGPGERRVPLHISPEPCDLTMDDAGDHFVIRRPNGSIMARMPKPPASST